MLRINETIEPKNTMDLESGTAYMELFPDDDTMLWVEDLKESIKYQNRGKDNPFENWDQYFRHFASLSNLAENIVNGIALFLDLECHKIKNILMGLDVERSDGRVSLAKFYSPDMKQEPIYFKTTPSYLKRLGALDDADPQRPSVVVANFISSRSMCMATSSGFHSVCCVNECDALMETLERGVSSPMASPSLIAELVAVLPSDTVAAPRNLSASLRRKLDLIASQHGGHVPLHGKMFALWMHHAFPYECPMPHASGAEAPLTHEEWGEQFGDPEATLEEYWALVNSTTDAASPHDLSEDTMFWSVEEELLTDSDTEGLGSSRHEGHGRFPGLLRLLRFLAMAIAVFATIATFWDSCRSSVFLVRPRQGSEKSLPSLRAEVAVQGRRVEGLEQVRTSPQVHRTRCPANQPSVRD